ncbi:hypothetical protein [Acidilobus sp.]|uniref:hypothetical protein n=1 Tax=Acidilobus sp. TaxID=1872109 RepID=UPI003CFDBF00
MQLIVAEKLRELGFDVVVEHRIDDVHVADVYAQGYDRSLIVEVETGYLPPMFIDRAEEYMEAKIAVKALKYSCAADEFYVATPSYLRLPIPHALLTDATDLNELKVLGSKVRDFFGDKWETLLLNKGSECKISGAMYVNISKRDVYIVKF